jgi:hypothetical protein
MRLRRRECRAHQRPKDGQHDNEHGEAQPAGGQLPEPSHRHTSLTQAGPVRSEHVPAPGPELPGANTTGQTRGEILRREIFLPATAGR